MKLTILLLAILLCSWRVTAQDNMQTLIDKDHSFVVGGYGGPSVRFSWFEQKPVVMVGAYGGVLINKKLMMGVGAYGMATQYTVPASLSDGYRRRWEMGYGGFVTEYIMQPNRLLHLQIGALIGAGGISKVFWVIDGRNNADENESYDKSDFFVAEPYVGIEVNVVKFMRLGINGSYRYISGANTRGVQDKDLSAPGIGFSLKFGKF